MIGALVSWSVLGVLYKLADRYRTRPIYITLLLHFCAAGYLIARGIFVSKSSFQSPAFVVFLGLVFGLSGSLGTLAGLYAVTAGKLSTTWLVVNMSVGASTVGAILIYHEPVTSWKASALILMGLAMVLLWQDMKGEQTQQGKNEPSSDQKSMVGISSKTKRWLFFVSIVFVCQTAAPFSMKILADRHLTDQYVFQFLLIMYISAGLLTPAIFRQRPLLPLRSELLISSSMAVCSVAGMTLTSWALAREVPAYLVFSLTQAGAVFFVVGAGVVIFKERLGAYGFLSLALGIIAAVMLST